MLCRNSKIIENSITSHARIIILKNLIFINRMKLLIDIYLSANYRSYYTFFKTNYVKSLVFMRRCLCIFGMKEIIKAIVKLNQVTFIDYLELNIYLLHHSLKQLINISSMICFESNVVSVWYIYMCVCFIVYNLIFYSFDSTDEMASVYSYVSCQLYQLIVCEDHYQIIHK